jgi:hypothetical protein
MKRKLNTKVETLRGYVVATEWDHFYRVTQLSIQTEDDEIIVDLSNAFGREMFDFLEQEIEVTGVVKQDPGGANIITITDFEQLYEEDDFPFDDDSESNLIDENDEMPY